MSRNPTRLEAGRAHVLTWCRECPPWRRLADDRPDALRQAADHVQRVHGNAKLAARLREQAAAAS